jgi:hypothetical protein
MVHRPASADQVPISKPSQRCEVMMKHEAGCLADATAVPLLIFSTHGIVQMQ